MATGAGTWGDIWASGRLGRFVLLCLGIWLHAADTLVTATLMPAAVGDIGGLAYVAWTVSLYQMGAVVAGAATAAQCRRLGAKRVLALASAAFGLGCVGAALAPTMGVLLAARFAQGLAGGALIALSYVEIQGSFPESARGRLFGVVSVIWGAGSLLGPLIGGAFAGGGAWRAAFWCFAAQAGLLCAASSALADLRPDALPAGRLPLRPILALLAASGLIAEAGIVGGRLPPVLVGASGLALLVAAGRMDGRSSGRYLPARALDPRRALGAGLLAVFALSAGTTGFWAYGPLLLQALFDTEPLVSGYILAGEALAWSGGTILVSAFPASAGTALIRVGAVSIVAGAAGFALAVPAGSLPGMVLCALLQGLGFGIAWPSIVGRVVDCAGEGEAALAAAAPGLLQRIGYAVGTAATGIVANASGLGAGMSASAARTAGFWIFAASLPLLCAGLAGAWRLTSER